MAFNYLSILGESSPHVNIQVLIYIIVTSMAVERVFSQGWHLLSHTRNSMSGKTIHTHLCLGSWSHKGLVHMKDLMEVIQATLKK
jgi:hypothetical protein